MKKTNSLWIVLGLTFIYVGIYLFLWVSSNNMAYNNTYIDKVFSNINIYENSNNNTEYSTGSEDLYLDKWTSGERINNTYNKVSIIYWNEVSPVAQNISTTVSVVNITRHSH